MSKEICLNKEASSKGLDKPDTAATASSKGLDKPYAAATSLPPGQREAKEALS